MQPLTEAHDNKQLTSQSYSLLPINIDFNIIWKNKHGECEMLDKIPSDRKQTNINIINKKQQENNKQHTQLL